MVIASDLNGRLQTQPGRHHRLIGSVYLGKILDPMAGLAADVTCDGRCTLDDITRLIGYVYLNGAAPGCP